MTQKNKVLRRLADWPFVSGMMIGLFGAACFGVGCVAASTEAANPGDWLSFAGTMIGASLTVAASFLVVEYQRANELRGRQQLLRDALDEITASLNAVLAENPKPGRASIYGAANDAAGSLRWLMRLTDDMQVGDFATGSALRILRDIPPTLLEGFYASASTPLYETTSTNDLEGEAAGLSIFIADAKAKMA